MRMGKEVGQYLVDADFEPQSFTEAAMKDDTHWATKALEAGVGINQLTSGKQTALMFACKYQSMEVFQLLMDRGVMRPSWSPYRPHSSLLRPRTP